MQEVEILRYNGCSGAGEIEGEGILDGSKVVKLEYEIFWEVGLVTPDHPTDANIRETEFVATGLQGCLVSMAVARRYSEGLRSVN